MDTSSGATTLDARFARERRSDDPALADATGREYDVHWLLTSSWKAGNFLRHAGVREGTTVGVVGDGPLALLAFFGTSLLEGRTRFDPPTDAAGLRAVVAPTDVFETGEGGDGTAGDGSESTFDRPRGCQRIGYGAKPAAPGVRHFDAGLWSENPSFPPTDVDPGTDLLTDGDRTIAHGRALETARAVTDRHGIDRGTRVGVAAPLSDPRTVVAGVLAPLLAGGVIVLGGAVPGAERDGPDVVVTDASAVQGAADADTGRSVLPLESISLEAES